MNAEQVKDKLSQLSKEREAVGRAIVAKWCVVRDLVIENPSTFDTLDQLELQISDIRQLKARAQKIAEWQRDLRDSLRSV